MSDRDVMKQALEALEHCCFSDALVTDKDVAADAILVLRNALEQTEWVSLTDDEIKAIIGPWSGERRVTVYTRALFNSIDEALRKKNHD